MRQVLRTACAILALPVATVVAQTNTTLPGTFKAPPFWPDGRQLYAPLHRGAVDLATGLYFRENEDLVVPGRPALILRRTYLSGYHASNQFGVGTLHNGEEYLIGDGERFQWVALILARGTRIEFTRTTPGTSLADAEYIHDTTDTEWRGATLIWTGLTWILQKRDGATLTFKGCGPEPRSVCSIIQSRDPEGRTTYYRRDPGGLLLKMEDGGARWISFEYDDMHRITRAYASTGRWVRYVYDDRGRLWSATTSEGQEYAYTYTDLDELEAIDEPGTSIVNTYANGRCIRQINNDPGAEPLVFEFAYLVVGGRIVQTDSRTSDGRHRSYTWNEASQTVAETLVMKGYDPIVFDSQLSPTTRSALIRIGPQTAGR